MVSLIALCTYHLQMPETPGCSIKALAQKKYKADDISSNTSYIWDRLRYSTRLKAVEIGCVDEEFTD